MRAPTLLITALALLFSTLSSAQTGYGRVRRGTPSGSPSPNGTYKDLAGTFHGKLKDITGKEIVIENEQNQIVSIRRTRKTKFLQDGKDVKASGIALGTALEVDVTEGPDLKPVALKVVVKAAPPAP